MEKIGFIGLGRMGRPMASNLIKKGFELIVHDVNAEAVDALVNLGADAGTSVADVAARSDVIITMLPNSAIVAQVISGADGVLSAARKGALVMDMSTIDPNTTDAIAADCKAHGIGFVDAPVGRLATHADIGQSLFMVGGEEADFERVKSMLEAMGSTIYHCGPCGAGTRSKIVNNFLAVSLCQLNAEALTLATGLGLDIENTLDVLYGTTATNGQLKINWLQKVLVGDTSAGFTIDLAHKDLTLVMESANAAKVPMPMAAAAREAFSQARARKFGGKDFSAMLDANCDAVGLEPPRLPQGSRHRT
ncbi:MAG: NAD(P)-binding domain-containing protein [Pseudotabrizicola sp.]|uniref:NAD(P)-dependent oxidoreductase n=1 Tax=Pseudotabrizicola sp. TaxID=2939647 RepID=UPI0027282BE8|nr:NAD(P)-binding domain-containing protein [Pseudotabrizicola sp.]MDO9638319.1 NAD(P)-binding domain-containing protein [Pseudotabrizicola sp.]